MYLCPMQMIPGLEEHLMNGSDENVLQVAELVTQSTNLINAKSLIIFLDPERSLQCLG